MSLSERVRLRELAKYYAVANIKARYSRHTPSAHDKYQQNLLDIDELREIKAQPANDRHLTALAQLAAHKLAYQRCFISIIDDTCQHFIAEATFATSLGSDGFQTQQDLMIGVQSVSLDQGWLPTTYTMQQKHFQLDLDEGKGSSGLDGMIIHDLASQTAFEQSNLLKAFPEAFRAYVEVPLLTSTGYVFGSICVVDNVARLPQKAELQQLREIADLIVDHLDTLRLKSDYGRAQRLLEGLAHFIEGKQSLSDWSRNTAGQAFIPVVDADVQDLSFIKPRNNLLRPMTSRSNSLSSAELSLQHCVSPTEEFQYVTPSTSEATDGVNVFDKQIEQTIAGVFDPAPMAAINEIDSQIKSTTTGAVTQAFSRASNLIRESMSLEATCFLEVPHNERAQLGSKRRSKTPPVDKGSEPSTSTDSSDLSTPEEKPGTPARPAICHRLAFSTKTKSSLAQSYATAKYLNIPANILKALATRYPRGRIFHFDSKGSVSSGEDGSQASSGPSGSDDKSLHKKRRSLSQKLAGYFPNARSLVFVPMYDSDRQHVFAGFLGWTANAARALQVHEVTFIKGFVDSVMCEVQRLEAISTDKAKSDFIASISHELRTPLHGILASSQLLYEDKKFEHQSELINMIDTCGRTLLDVMDHLLDHAKINHFTQRNEFEKTLLRGENKIGRLKTFSLVSQVNLASIVEETAASVAASSNQLLKRRRDISRDSEDTDFAASETLSVPLILDINKEQRWSFQTESGSWRRIIMNLIGNSLKYTATGHVSVRLSLSKENTPTAVPETYMVELRVIDTGQGISKEYLKRRLFTAFAQEDNLSVGTGLGLSLVNSIVSTLNGKIEVQSEVGQGTEILVRIPVTAPPDAPIREAFDSQAVSALIGMRVAISGFAEAPGTPTGILEPRVTALLTLKQSLTTTVIDWFQMTVVSANAEVDIVEYSYLDLHLKVYDEAQRNILVIGTEGLQNLSIGLTKARYVYVAVPIGPARLAKALQSLLEMMQNNFSEPNNQITPQNSSDESKSTIDTFNSLPSSPQRAKGQAGHEIQDGEDSPHMMLRPPQRRSSSNQTVLLLPLHPSANGTAPHPTILLVDDNDINLRVLVTFVRRLQTHQIITASNGKEALELFTSSFTKGNAISTVFMDINMPVLDGLEATRRIRQYESNHKHLGIPAATIVALTGLGSEESQDQIESSGFDQYLRKPVSLKQLREILLS